MALLGLMRHRLDQQADAPTPSPRFDEQAVRHYLLARIDQPVTLPRLADAFALSTAQFSRLFCAHFGASPIRYHTRLRIEHAAELLAHTDLPIAAVALRTGYDDPYHFARVFKQQTGDPPGRYRQRRPRG